MPGRIEHYIHSDASVENKVGCLVEVTCETDFAAKDEKFKSFSQIVAKYACAYRVKSWTELLEGMLGKPIDLHAEKMKLENELKEKINVTKIALMILDGEACLGA